MDPAAEIELAVLSRQTAMKEAIALGSSEIQRFYKNSVVLITGGSGFLGKQLIEKLLRSCNISKIYLLIRPKKGKSVQQRLDSIVNEPVFDALRKLQPNFAAKIVLISGDVAEINLGLKDDDFKTLVEEVEVIFHVAATTKFDETIRVATLINVRGTREILQLGKACRNLKAFVHVSTAYTHATDRMIGGVVDEEFYKCPIPPETLISMAETMDQDRLVDITAGLIKNWPNTYTFTKTVSEELVRTASAGLPISIVRPGIVLCSYSEPSPGWLDLSCVYSATGFLLGLGLGVLHTIYADAKNVLGFIPCDYVNNAIIAAGKEAATNQAKGGNDTKIYTLCTTQRNPVTWGEVTHVIKTEAPKFSTPSAVYYVYAHDTKNRFIYMLLTLFLHFIPAYIADFVCLLAGKERRYVKTIKKVYNMVEVLSHFLLNEWKFIDDNTSKLYNNLSKDDKVIFNFDITDIDWTEYVLLWCIGTRKYIIKDGLKGTNYAVKKRRIMRVVHYVLMALYLYCIFKVMCFVLYFGGILFSTFKTLIGMF